MKPTTREWVEKAEHDFASAARELRARKSPNYDDACFHAQQCAEKYLKARLEEAGIAAPKVHDLPALLDMATPVEPLWEGLRQHLSKLSAYAVNFRYPGESADKPMAREALVMCKKVREVVRSSLGLKL
jgi:HEPN domain-containing protein